MGEGMLKDGIAPGRLAPAQYAANFSDLHPPLDRHEAFVEADRCYFCFDAPCQTACPTSIDIPMFIREILTDNPLGAAETIFEQNILGGMCARVCPTEQLCEEACVREEIAKRGPGGATRGSNASSCFATGGVTKRADGCLLSQRPRWGRPSTPLSSLCLKDQAASERAVIVPSSLRA